MEFQVTWFPEKSFIRVDLHTRLSPTINVNKTEMGNIQTDSATIREIKKRKSSKKSALSTWPFIYKYSQMQTQLAMRKICAEDEAGSKVHMSDMFISLEFKGYLHALLSIMSSHLSRSEAHMRSNRLSCVSLIRRKNFTKHQPSCENEMNLSLIRNFGKAMKLKAQLNTVSL